MLIENKDPSYPSLIVSEEISAEFEISMDSNISHEQIYGDT